MYHPMAYTQLEIEFFWPLTEQIPLDLDYTGCHTRPHISTTSPYVSTTLGITSTTTWGVPVMKLSEDAVTFTYKEEPPWYRKMLFKLIGFKWEKR